MLPYQFLAQIHQTGSNFELKFFILLHGNTHHDFNFRSYLMDSGKQKQIPAGIFIHLIIVKLESRI